MIFFVDQNTFFGERLAEMLSIVVIAGIFQRQVIQYLHFLLFLNGIQIYLSIDYFLFANVVHHAIQREDLIPFFPYKITWGDTRADDLTFIFRDCAEDMGFHLFLFTVAYKRINKVVGYLVTEKKQ